MKKLFVAFNAIVITATLSFSMLAQNNRQVVPRPTVLTVGQKVTLGCKNPGSHQDVSKDPTITNTSGKTIKKGSKIRWTVLSDIPTPVSATVMRQSRPGSIAAWRGSVEDGE